MAKQNLELGNIVYFIDDVSIPGSVRPDGELHRAVVTGIMDDTVQLGILDGQDPHQAKELVQRSPEDVVTADEVLGTVFEVGTPEAISVLSAIIAQR